MTHNVTTIPQEKAPPIKHKKSEAEKEFDKRAYVGFGGIITIALSVLSADWVNYGGGKEKCARLANRIGNSVSHWSGLTRARCVDMAHSWILTTALMMGGVIMLVPIKRMEDAKPTLTRKYYERKLAQREAAGEVVPEEEKAEAEAALQAIEARPRPSWGEIITGRVIGTAGVYAALSVVGRPLKQAVTNIADATATAVTSHRGQAHHIVKRYTDSALMDTLATTLCTSTLYAYTHLNQTKKKTEPSNEEDPQMVAENGSSSIAYGGKIGPRDYKQILAPAAETTPASPVRA